MVNINVGYTIEKAIIDELNGYKRLCARIKVLEHQPAGMGYQVSRIGTDKLQELHKSLKGLSSHMYLNPREQELEMTAYAHLDEYPVGIRAQHNEVRRHHGVDAEDHRNLKDLSKSVQKVREARGRTKDSYTEVDERESELVDKRAEKERIDFILDAVRDVKEEYAKLLILRYVEWRGVDEVADALGIVRKTFDRWRPRAIEEYAAISGMSQTCLKNVP